MTLGGLRFTVIGFCAQAENEDDESGQEGDTPGRKRKKIRKILKDKKLSQQTVDAAKAEEERRKRTEERQKLVSDLIIYFAPYKLMFLLTHLK